MNVKRHAEISSLATRLQTDLWQKRSEIWSVLPDADGLLPIPVDVIAREILGLQLEEPEEVPAEHRSVEFETAGFIDRDRRRIVVAQKHRLEFRRFTIAHEIGHWVLHPDIYYHRDRPLQGGERSNPKRPQAELEADAFAAELLMPKKVLTKKFMTAFGGTIDGRNADQHMAFWLSAGTHRKVNEIDLSSSLRYRSMLIAESSSFRSSHFPPLVKIFGVSPTAMAIQLEELRLVI